MQLRAAASGAASTAAGSPLAGIGLTLLSGLLFAGGNALAKLVMEDIPVGEALFVRTVVTLLLLAPLLQRGDLARAREAGKLWLHALRVTFSAVEVGCYYAALVVLPLADVSTIYLAAPIYVTGLSAVLLGEPVGWRRWSAVLAGFAGVVVAMQPGGSAFSGLALVALAGSLLYAISVVATRRLRGTPTTVLVISQVAALMLGSALTAPGWVRPDLKQMVIMALLGVLSMGGYLCMNRGLQLAQASVLAPFNYGGIVWAVLLGWVVFKEVPGAPVLLGAATVVAAGLFIVLRERRLGVA